jgi:peptidyl-prolyl cis-trans isomerase A (cyclophilin A)
MTIRCIIAVCLGIAVGACDGCESESAGTTNLNAPSTEPSRAVTEDGYEVVLSSQQARARREREEERARRAEEQLTREPNSPDPLAGREFTLEQAVEGLPLDGQLVVEIGTELGVIFCDLEADKAPKTVANFIGLARGLRPWWDPRAGEWVTRPLYRDTHFYRVVPDYLVQAGDVLDDGTGRVGYAIPDEIHESLRLHDRAGLLAMASQTPNENGGQWFITDGPASELDGGYTIFGECQPLDVISRIARVPQTGSDDNRPVDLVAINRVLIRRVAGGAEQARPTPPQTRPGFETDMVNRQASPGPSELDRQIELRRQQADDGHMH